MKRVTKGIAVVALVAAGGLVYWGHCNQVQRIAASRVMASLQVVDAANSVYWNRHGKPAPRLAALEPLLTSPRFTLPERDVALHDDGVATATVDRGVCEAINEQIGVRGIPRMDGNPGVALAGTNRPYSCFGVRKGYAVAYRMFGRG